MPPKRRHCHGDPGVHQDTAASLSPLPEARLSHGALPAGGHRVPPGPPWPASPGPTPEPTVGAAAARGSAEPAKERSRRPRHEAARGRRSRRHTGTRPHLRGQEHRRRRGPQKPAPSPLSRARPRRGAPTGRCCCPRARPPFPVQPASWPAGADRAEPCLRGASHPCRAAHGAQLGLTAASRVCARGSRTRAQESVRPLPFLPHLHHGCQVPAINPDSGGGAERAEQHGRFFCISHP